MDERIVEGLPVTPDRQPRGIVLIGVGISRFIGPPAPLDPPALDPVAPDAEPPLSAWVQHRYDGRAPLSPARKRELAARWMERRWDGFQANRRANFAAIDRLIAACKAKRLRPILFDLPLNVAVVGHRLDEPLSVIRGRCTDIARRNGIKYLRFNRSLGLRSAVFWDLHHLLGPGYHPLAVPAFGRAGQAAAGRSARSSRAGACGRGALPGRAAGTRPPMDAQRIIRTYYGIAATTTLAQALIWGVNTLFLLSVGFDIFEVMLINAAYTVAQVVFEVPTGVVADTVGRRVSYLLAVGTILVSTLLYVGFGLAGYGIWPFVAASALLGIGYTFYTGAVDAWMVDALQSVGYEGTPGADLRPLRDHVRHLHADRHDAGRLARPDRPLDPLRACGPSCWCPRSCSASW